jgi:hypothetical protein
MPAHAHAPVWHRRPSVRVPLCCRMRTAHMWGAAHARCLSISQRLVALECLVILLICEQLLSRQPFCCGSLYRAMLLRQQLVMSRRGAGGRRRGRGDAHGHLPLRLGVGVRPGVRPGQRLSTGRAPGRSTSRSALVAAACVQPWPWRVCHRSTPRSTSRSAVIYRLAKALPRHAQSWP